MTVRGKIEIMNPKIQSQTHILMIQSQTLLFSTILQATQMHILSPYSPGACTLQYTTTHAHPHTCPPICMVGSRAWWVACMHAFMGGTWVGGWVWSGNKKKRLCKNVM